jgi:hypothetical protein
MKVNHTHQIVGLRLAVGLLGEQEQLAWWPSGFLGRHAQAFLNPIFGSKTLVSQYHGVTEAACRVHDEKIGVGRVFHLYRLPETIEQRISDAFQEGSLPEDVTRCFESTDAAESVLARFGEGIGGGETGAGQDRRGRFDQLARRRGPPRRDLPSSLPCRYPYFTNR